MRLRLSALLPVVALVPLACGSTSDGDGDGGSGFGEVRSDAPHEEAPSLEPGEAEALADDNLALTLDLYHQLRGGEAEGVGFSISAYSIHSAFGMLYAGAVDPARAEMAETLHFSLAGDREHVGHNWLDAQLASRNLPAITEPENEQAAVELQTANGVWILDALAEQVEPAFLDTLAVHYDAGVFLAEFDTQPEVEREAINGWVSERTATLIPELFPQGTILPTTTMVLVNAVYLKAPWAEPFEESVTAPAPFFDLEGGESQVDMMHNSELAAEHGAGDGWVGVAIPMRGGDLELVVIVPEDFEGFEATLDAQQLAEARDSMAPGIVDLRLPRFEVEAALELTDELQALGMISPFVDGGSFDAILPNLGVITAVVHQTVIVVDERGTEAAAATGIAVGETGIPEPDATLTVDRPFLLGIRDAPTDTWLFFGRVLQP